MAFEWATDDVFTVMLEATYAAVLITDADGHIQFANAATEQMFGYSRGDLIGQLVEFLVPLRLRRKHAFLRRRFLAKPEPRSLGGRNFFGARRGNAEFPVQIGLSPFATDTGLKILATLVDVSATRAQETSMATHLAELERANERLSQFAALACRDLQEPLVEIAHLSQALDAAVEARDQAGVAAAAETIRRSARNARALVDDVLIYARAANCDLQKEVLDVRVEVEAALRNLAKPIAETGAEAIVKAPSLSFEADRQQFANLLRNILSNAIKYRKPGEPPKIHIAARARDGLIRLDIGDEGVGFDEAFARMIFEPFRKVECKTDYAGSGVDLATCKTIADRHGWEISVRSRTGRGTVFSILIPEYRAKAGKA